MDYRGTPHSPATVKYNGLWNKGATCNLNSVLQVLFMTKEFREAVERHNYENSSTTHIDHHLKTLFDELKRRTGSAVNIMKALGIQNVVKHLLPAVYEQHFAVEYFERILTLTTPEASQVFCGELTRKIKCSRCGKENNMDGRFWSLPLELVNSYNHIYSVVGGIEQFFKTSEISGENQIYCEQCGAKTNASVKHIIKNHPKVLTLMLTRFEFNNRFKIYETNYCWVDVPHTLHMSENKTYELYAVVDVFQYLTYRYYTASIKSQDDDTWYRFSDSIVTQLDYEWFQEINKRSSSAYLLFYRKQKKADILNQDIRGAGCPEGFQTEGAQNKQIAEGEESKEECDDTAEAPEEKGNKDMTRPGFAGTDQMSKEEEHPRNDPDRTDQVEDRLNPIRQKSGAQEDQGFINRTTSTRPEELNVQKRVEVDKKKAAEYSSNKGESSQSVRSTASKKDKIHHGSQKNDSQIESGTFPAPIKYNGLRNEGATCNLNSVLQVLFMTKEFREAVERHNYENSSTTHIDHHLKTLFDELKRRTGSAVNIMKALGIQNVVKHLLPAVYEEHFAVEYFERILTLTSPEASQVFCGELTRKIKCSRCGKENNMDGRFWSLPLELVNSYNHIYSVVGGIEQFFKTSEISGENQIYCEQCGAKTNASVKHIIKNHPKVLTLMLTRFEFNNRFKIYETNYCWVDVPHTLHMPENKTYELYAVVDYSGYYTASIKSQDDDTWYRFSDYIVTQLDYEWFQEINKRSSSAYLLFYRKQKKADILNQDIRGAGCPEGFQTEGAQNKQIAEGEESKEECDDTAEAPEEKGNKDMTRPGFAGTDQMSKEEEHPRNDPDRTDQVEDRLNPIRQKSGAQEDQGFINRTTSTRPEELNVQKRVEVDKKKAAEYSSNKGESSQSVRSTASKKDKIHHGSQKNDSQIESGTFPAPIKYNGLRNEGATCNLNSVLQVLFMTKEFREAVERHNYENSSTTHIDHHLKTLFDELKRRTGSAVNIMKALGIQNVVKHLLPAVYEEHFAVEYFERILTLTSPEASQVFCGELTRKIKCSRCGKENHTDGRFWSLPLELVNSYNHIYSVVGGIEQFFKTSEISGENQIYCEQCGAKTNASVKHIIKNHPKVLTLMLTRFEFNNRFKIYETNYCWVDVPHTLHMPENKTYELYAVVDYSGYYTASIKSQDDDTWYRFSDYIVTQLDYERFQEINKRSSSAYLLFYRKQKKADILNQDIRGAGCPEGFQTEGAQNKQIAEGEESKEECDDTAEAPEEKGNKDMTRPGSAGTDQMSKEEEHPRQGYMVKHKETPQLIDGGVNVEQDTSNYYQGKEIVRDTTCDIWKTEERATRNDPERTDQVNPVRQKSSAQKDRGFANRTTSTRPEGLKVQKGVEVDKNKDAEYIQKKGESSKSVRSTASKKDQKVHGRQKNSRTVNYGASPAPIKYNGLWNQGQTCYLNSVLQVLFMTKEFREAVERNTCETADSKYVDRHLKRLFDELKKRTCSTVKITEALGIHNVHQQQDAVVYFEKILGLTSPQVSQIFHGVLTHQHKCCGCGMENDTDASFWSLPLALVDSNTEDYSVVEGVKNVLKTSEIGGENQIYCEQCSAKANASVKRIIKTHPEVLMLLLKRFEFNYHYMSFVKIDCCVDISCILHIPQDQIYELYAVVNHVGSPRSGHYTVTIKSQDDDRWYSFNDSIVTRLHEQFEDKNTIKSHSAYLLLYRKKNSTVNQDNSKQLSPEGRENEGAPCAHTDDGKEAEDEAEDSARYQKRKLYKQ